MALNLAASMLDPPLHLAAYARRFAADMAVGGKGANQAVAAARLAAGTRPVRFVTRFGNDSHGAGRPCVHWWSCRRCCAGHSPCCLLRVYRWLDLLTPSINCSRHDGTGAGC